MKRTYEECVERYGGIREGRWPDEFKWCSYYPLPAGIKLVNSITGAEVVHFYCNRDMGPSLMAAFKNVLDRGIVSELKTFDGCYMIRDVRGDAGKPSTHSYALAVDLNAKENPLGGPVAFSPQLVRCFTDQGFDWGGNFHRCDPMHFSFGWE